MDTNETPALNQAGISYCNLIRYKTDPNGLMLVEKLGGWSKYYGSPVAAPVRALAAWEDLYLNSHVAYGTQNVGNTSQSNLGVITGNSSQLITPTSTTDNVTPLGNTTSGSPTVIITDATTGNITSYDSVFIETHVSVGGVVLYGQYPTTQGNTTTTYTVQAADVLGNPEPATSSAGNATVAQFVTSTGSNIVTVNLPNHGYSVGSTYPALVSTVVGNVTIYGNYLVQSVGNATAFTIQASNSASGNASGYINGNLARYVYSFGVGAIPQGSGYGIGGYGSGGYGTGTGITPATGTPISATDWTLDNFGEVLIANPVNGTLFQPLYQWDPASGSPLATVIPNAPTVNDGFFIAMPERQIVTWGSTATGIQDPLLVNWCDVNNYNQWIALPTNQAGSFRIPKGSKIVGGIQAAQQGLLWTDIDLWSMQYIGLPDVYGFNEIGTGCGLIARKAAASYNEVVYWMGPSQFYSLAGASSVSAGGVMPLACPVWDVVFQQLDQNNLSKIRVAVNSMFGEITWYYPTMASGGENAAYVKYNALVGQWDYGNLARSAWVDQSVVGKPIGADPNLLYIYQHETSPDADGQPLLASFTTGYFAISEGDYKTFIDQIWTDARYGYWGSAQNATLNMTILTANYPSETPTAFGPYAMTQSTKYFSPRLRGRLCALQFSSNDTGTWWRIGGARYRGQPDGKYG